MQPTFLGFLGIGCFRCGTTWLHELLNTHPDIYVPQQRKELNFFRDPHYAKGWGWYEQFFPAAGGAGRYKAIGEISPGYIYELASLERIKKLEPVPKLIVMIRNPVKRAYSTYRWNYRLTKNPPAFEDALQDIKIEHGLYAQHLEPWLKAFGQDGLLVLVSEHVFADIPAARRSIAQALGVDPDRFPENAGIDQINESQTPKHLRAYQLAVKAHLWLRDRNLDRIVPILKKVGVKKLFGFGQGGALPPMSEQASERLQGYYADDINRLELMLGVDLSDWKRAD